MIVVLSCVIYCVGGLMAQTYSGPPATPAIDMTAKPVMCSYDHNLNASITPKIGVECFPCECEIIVFDQFSISNKSVITVETEILKKVASLKPTIVVLHRDGHYSDMDAILTPGPDSYKKDAEVLCKFAIEYGIVGFLLEDISPDPGSMSDTFVTSVMGNLPGYMKLLKFSENAIIGVRIYAWKVMILNRCLSDFAAMNQIVSYYEVCTFLLNGCEPSLSLSVTPIAAKERFGPDYQYGMQEVTECLKTTEVDFSKVYLVAEIYPKEATDEIEYLSYNQVCSGSNSSYDTWCIPHTKDFYDKGSYIKSENCGMNVIYVQLDDVNNACGCGPFVGFQNLIAGYKGGSALPCPKFDVGI